MKISEHMIPLYDASGKLYAVMLSAELWERGKKRLEPAIHSTLASMTPQETVEPLEEWETFSHYWDFKYPLTKDVSCGCCSAFTENWQEDPEKKFLLKSAQLGGLVVFDCLSCGATVRKKYFKDHYCFEFTEKK